MAPNGTPQALEELGKLPDASTIEALRDADFNLAALSYTKVKAEIEKLEAEKRRLSDIMCAALITADIKSVRAGRLRVTRVDGRGPSQLKKEKLLEAGVSADIIIACTVPGKEYTTVQVTEIKEKVA